jgi:hypothetical protein
MRKQKENKKELPVITSEVLLQKPVGEFSKEAFKDYGDYINNHRHMAEVRDGCKISYRRLIYSATLFPKGKLIPTVNLISSMSGLHPHSLDGCLGLNSSLVRSGVFSGEGSFGYTEIGGDETPPAAARYTKTRLSDLYLDIIGDLLKDIPFVESPVGAPEPEYLPFVFPLCLYLRDTVVGLGVGISTVYPNFSPKSMYQAYIHNNPQLLEPNVDLILDKSASELERLWTTGKGRVVYSYKISRVQSPDGKSEGILFETKDGTGIFTPRVSRFSKLENEGKVYIEDLTDFDGPKLFVGRVPGAKNITIEEIEAIARKICYDATTYQLNVTDGKTAFRIPLYDWLDFCYKNYINLITAANARKIETCKFNISVLEALPIITDYILNKNPKADDKELQKNLGFSEEIISVVMSKPISYLRKNKDTADRIKKLKDELKSLKQFDPVKYTEEIINKL